MKTKIETNIHIGGRKEVCPEEVILLIANENYTQIIFNDGSKAMVATTLKELEKRFKEHPSFFRIHRSFMINLSYVMAFETLAENYIKMSNEAKVIVSRRKKNAFQNKLQMIV